MLKKGQLFLILTWVTSLSLASSPSSFAGICALAPYQGVALSDQALTLSACSLKKPKELALLVKGYVSCSGIDAQETWEALTEKTRFFKDRALKILSGEEALNPLNYGLNSFTPEQRARALKSVEFDAKMPTEDLTYLSIYLGSGYVLLNRILRLGGNASECLQPLSEHLTALFSEFPTYEGKVWRGTSIPKPQLEAYQKVGAEIVWPAFSSTSVDPKVAGHFGRAMNPESKGVIFEIQSRNCRNLDGASDFNEKEVLCLPGTRFRVLSFKNTSADQVEIQLEEVP